MIQIIVVFLESQMSKSYRNLGCLITFDYVMIKESHESCKRVDEVRRSLRGCMETREGHGESREGHRAPGVCDRPCQGAKASAKAITIVIEVCTTQSQGNCFSHCIHIRPNNKQLLIHE